MAAESRFGTRVGWVALGRFVNLASLLAINALLSRTLLDIDYGRYQQVWLVINVAVPLFLFGFPLSLNFFLPQLSERERHEFTRQTVMVIVGAGLLFGGGLLALAPQLAARFGDATLTPLLRLGAVIGLCLIGSGFLESFLINYNRHSWLALSLSAFSVLLLAAVAIGRLIGASLAPLFACMAIVSVLRLASSLVLVAVLTRPAALRWRGEWWRRQFRYSLPIGLRDGIDVISKWLDKLLITALFSTREFAYYFNGAFQAPIVDLMVQSILKVVLPDLAGAYHREDRDEFVRIVRFSESRIGFLILPIAAYLFVVGPDVMALLFGESYRISGDYFRVFTMVIPIRATIGGTMLTAVGRSDRLLYGTLLDVALILLLSAALTPLIGLFGPAVASVLATYCQAAYNLNEAGKALRRSFIELVPWGSLLRIGALCAAVGAASSFCLFFDAPLWNIAAAAALFWPLFGLIGYFGRVFSDDERQSVRNNLGRLRRRAGRGPR